MLQKETARMFIDTQQLAETNLRAALIYYGFNPDIQYRKLLTGHNVRVAVLALLDADGIEEFGYDFPIDKSVLAAAARFHDTGKFEQITCDTVFPSSKVLPRDFNSPAQQIIRTHPVNGSLIPLAMETLSEEFKKRVARVIYYHHERYDGQGYYKMPAEKIPNESFVIAVADSIDVMLGKRGYAHRRDLAGTLEEIATCSKTQFHPIPAEAAIKKLQTKSGQLIQYIKEYTN